MTASDISFDGVAIPGRPSPAISARKTGCAVGLDQELPICWKCRRRIGAGLAPDSSGHCELCAETSSFAGWEVDDGDRPSGASDETFRLSVVARLRACYAAARDLVDPTECADSHREHLEWILGSRSNPDRDDASIGVGVSALMVLWLEDLISDLDRSTGGLRTLPRLGSAVTAQDRRLSVARGLRIATRDFAAAFVADRNPAGSQQ